MHVSSSSYGKGGKASPSLPFECAHTGLELGILSLHCSQSLNELLVLLIQRLHPNAH